MEKAIARQQRRRFPAVTECGVCGQVAHNHHFGGPCCESCKAFFRRAVQKNAHLLFTCIYSGNCSVTQHERKCCQKCRFEKCLSIGMSPKLVMGEKERRVRAVLRAGTVGSNNNNYIKSLPQMIERMYDPEELYKKFRLSDAEFNSVMNLLADFRSASAKLSGVHLQREVASVVHGNDSALVISTCVGNRTCSALFAMSVPDFLELDPVDHHALFKQNVPQMSVLRSSATLNTKTTLSKTRNVVMRDNFHKVDFDVICGLSSPTLVKTVENLVDRFYLLRLDEACLALLMIIVFFSPSAAGLVNVDKVEAIQEKYLDILRKYVQWRYGALSVTVVYPKILAFLTDAREIYDRRAEKDLGLKDDAIESLINKMIGWSIGEDYVSPLSIESVVNSDGGYGTDSQDGSQSPNTVGDLYELLDSIDDVATMNTDSLVSTEDLLLIWAE